MIEKYSKDDPTYQILSKSGNPSPSDEFTVNVMEQIKIEAVKKQISYTPLINKNVWAIIIIVLLGITAAGFNLDFKTETFDMDNFMDSVFSLFPVIQVSSWVGISIILVFAAIVVNIVIENINIRKRRSAIPFF
jgi:hypothetical protein